MRCELRHDIAAKASRARHAAAAMQLDEKVKISTDISRIASGETAQIILPDLGGLELTAKVSSVGSIKDIGWGLLFSTIITLFVIPSLFCVAHEATAFLNRIKMRLTRQELQ